MAAEGDCDVVEVTPGKKKRANICWKGAVGEQRKNVLCLAVLDVRPWENLEKKGGKEDFLEVANALFRQYPMLFSDAPPVSVVKSQFLGFKPKPGSQNQKAVPGVYPAFLLADKLIPPTGDRSHYEQRDATMVQIKKLREPIVNSKETAAATKQAEVRIPGPSRIFPLLTVPVQEILMDEAADRLNAFTSGRVVVSSGGGKRTKSVVEVTDEEEGCGEDASPADEKKPRRESGAYTLAPPKLPLSDVRVSIPF
jgi:hypothetical protein